MCFLFYFQTKLIMLKIFGTQFIFIISFLLLWYLPNSKATSRNVGQRYIFSANKNSPFINCLNKI